ncbi:hypothetical protein D3261_03985 [Halococcus sp. IIIV-5B]|nr:hypothetical protein D3261_03985 [Halococcus sp. IIIV-5B]
MASDKTESMATEIIKLLSKFENELLLVFALSLSFGLLAALITLAVPSGTGSYVVAVITVIVNGAILSMVSPIMYLCRRHNDVHNIGD